MENNRERAWKHLTQKEQTALSLIVVSDRSKLEASVIMNLSPYKFNEIYLRARKFFILFSEYYEKNEALVPEEWPMSLEFRIFLQFLLSNRKKASVIFRSTELPSIIDPKIRTREWENLYSFLTNKETDQTRDFLNLLREFDKWNNFRILPGALQGPSAFPRRRNKEFKKIYESLNQISELSWELVFKMYSTDIPPFIYVPVIYLQDFKTVSFKKREPVITYLSKNRIPTFETEKEAFGFAELIHDYNSLLKKSPYSAKKFWANFRTKLKKAINYNDLLHIHKLDVEEITSKDKQFIQSIGITNKQLKRGTQPNVFW